ncbi:MAG: DNA-processing protein DprA, partial [Halofilum sp. (in: g-proteobacteria)]
AQRIRTASRAELTAAGLKPETIEALSADAPPAGVERDREWAAAAADRHLLTLADPRYPARLAAIADPPPVLYVQGDPEVLAYPALAIVGTRHPTPAGEEIAHDFARHLAASGLVIVSGLALGIDGAAHEGALAAGGLTVAAAGTGLDRIYPARHQTLARRIAAEGALVSELPVGTRPSRSAFPRRNRILAGLCEGTLVVEAAVRSGSLITARLALEQDRDVFAIPGSIHNPVARGCHQLIRQGAKLVETADDVLEELAPRLGERPHAPDAASAPQSAQPPEDPEYARLYACLDWQPRGIDDLAARSGLGAGEVASMLLRLELEGQVRIAPGGLYQRV